MIGDAIALFVTIGFPIGAMVYGALVIADDDFVSDYSNTFLGD